MSCNSNIPVGYKIIDCKYDLAWNKIELEEPIIDEVPLTADCLIVCKTDKHVVLEDYKSCVEYSIADYEKKLELYKKRLKWAKKELEKEDIYD